MSDFFQNGLITTLHDFDTVGREHLERLLEQSTRDFKLGLVLPVTAADMRAEPFGQIVEQLHGVGYVEEIVVVLGVAPEVADYREAVRRVAPLGDRARVLWSTGPRMQALYQLLVGEDLNLSVGGKGRSAWAAFGYLLANPRLKAFVLHDCDIVGYDRELLARLCLPMAHPSLDFEFCKAYYARVTDRMYGRVVRLLVTPMLRALMSIIGYDHFLLYLDSFRYPLAGEFAVTAALARSNRVPNDWGLEVGTLAEVYRNTSIKRVCQVNVCARYEHKHSPLSLDSPDKGLMKMATDILASVFHTLASMGVALGPEHFTTLRNAYLRMAQDAVRQYHADALLNGLRFDRHDEEVAVEGFADRIAAAAEVIGAGTVEAIPNWARVLTAFPDFPQRLRQAVEDDAGEYA